MEYNPVELAKEHYNNAEYRYKYAMAEYIIANNTSENLDNIMEWSLQEIETVYNLLISKKND